MMLIDPRIHYVGTSCLRKWGADWLRGIADHLYVIQVGDKPVAVLLSYETFMALQSREGQEK
jgi:hypothetical protein